MVCKVQTSLGGNFVDSNLEFLSNLSNYYGDCNVVIHDMFYPLKGLDSLIKLLLEWKQIKIGSAGNTNLKGAKL